MKPAERDELLLEMNERLVRIETKIEVLPDHEKRLRGLERWRYGIPAGIGTAILALLGLPGSTPHS